MSRVETGYHFIALRVRFPPREQTLKQQLNMNNKPFNPAEALEQLSKTAQTSKNPTFTEQINSMNNSIAFIKKIHDDAFAQGFEEGIEASKKVDKYDSN